ncbi:C10 family peptidase [Parabacteroides sp. OttesenSCG-928-N08]|nr:C10 family peptidase [Parabacteroides sp. OttesenSCG-928-N08]
MEVFGNKRARVALLFALISSFSWMTQAATVSKELAAERARRFLQQRVGETFRAATLSSEPAYTAFSTQPGFEHRACFYLFTDRLNGGFVLVAGDDRAYPILGYSTEESFEPTEMPPAMHWWLERYRQQIESLITTSDSGEQQTAASYHSHHLLRSEEEEAVSKSFATAGWHQRSPFNLFCPQIDGEATAAGCVATCMAIIMRYHKSPIRGTGQHSYSWRGETLTANFDYPYDWDQMVMHYDKKATPEQCEAVATLIYHCGIALESTYGVESTGAYMSGVHRAFIRFFGYDEGIERKAKQYIEKEEWMRLIHHEIDAGRPLIYSGTGKQGIGHMFVCDGYAEQDMIHINWGWGRQFNAFYRVDALNAPNSISYTEKIEMMIGIQPASSPATGNYSELRLVGHYGGNGLTIEGENNRLDRPFKATISSIVSLKTANYSGKIAVALVDKKRRIKEIVGESSIMNLSYKSHLKQITVSCTLKQLANPEDMFCVVADDDTGKGWQLLRADSGLSDVVLAKNHIHPYDVSSIGAINEEEILIGWSDQSLEITTTQAEQIDLYTLQGQRLFTTRKAPGTLLLPPLSPHTRTLIIHGSSGWSKIISYK